MAASFLSKISNPIVVIFGATGTGKSKLAVEIAKRFNGEVISVDSMQVYTGLDIITNKVTREEQEGVPHHLLDFINPLNGITCIDFRDRALKIIEDVNTRKKLPILVGGTLYYLESILFDLLVPEPIETKSSDHLTYGYKTWTGGKEEDASNSSKIKRNCAEEDISSEDVYKRVLEVDPEMAQFLHPGDKRKGLREFVSVNSPALVLDKIRGVCDHTPNRGDAGHPPIAPWGLSSLLAPESFHADGSGDIGDDSSSDASRNLIQLGKYRPGSFQFPGLTGCLEVFETSGEKLSSILEKQKSQPGSTGFGGPLRFLNSVMLWLRCDKSVLDKRLDERVDKMVEAGLVQELLDFHKEYNKIRVENNELPDYTLGIFQAIGFKEFHDYLVLDEEDRESAESKKLLEKCIANLKLVTRRYARKQLKWIQSRFLRRGEGLIPPIYGLDATDVSLWNEKVLSVATEIVDSLLNDRKPSCEQLPVTYEVQDRRKINKCDLCNRYFKGEEQFRAHLKGNRHQKMKKKSSVKCKGLGDDKS